MSLPHLTNTNVIPDSPLSAQETALQALRRRIFYHIVITLTSLVLDIGRLTRAGIESLQRVVARSSIRFLRIDCSTFD